MMKTTDRTISKALEEVWEWKEAVYNDIKDMTFEEQKKYFKEGLDYAAKLLNAKLMKNEDGTYSIV